MVRGWVNHPAVDYVVAAGVGLLAVGIRAAGVHPLEHWDVSGRLVWMQTTVGASVALLGFAVTATTIFYAVTPGPRLKLAMGKVGPGLTRLLVSSLWAQAAGSLALLVAMPLYNGERAGLVGVVVLTTIVVVALRSARLIWLFSRLLTAFASEAHDAVLPPLVEGWQPPVIDPDDYPVAVRRSLRAQRRARKRTDA